MSHFVLKKHIYLKIRNNIIINKSGIIIFGLDSNPPVLHNISVPKSRICRGFPEVSFSFFVSICITSPAFLNPCQRNKYKQQQQDMSCSTGFFDLHRKIVRNEERRKHCRQQSNKGGDCRACPARHALVFDLNFGRVCNPKNITRIIDILVLFI